MSEFKLNWLLDMDFYEGEQEGLRDAITAEGMEWKELTRRAYYMDRFDAFPKEERTFFVGTIQVAQTIKRAAPHIEVLLDEEAMRCASYYPLLAPYLLNDKYVMVPIGELCRLRPWLQEMFPSGVFLRPDSGSKLFSGCVMEDDQEAFDKWYRFTTYGMDDGSSAVKPWDLVVAAAAFDPTQIRSETRFFVIDYEVVAWSKYKDGSVSVLSADVSPEDIAYAREVVASVKSYDKRRRYRKGFVLDTCTFGLDPAKLSRFVVEINSVSCSGMYACDRGQIVRAVRNVLQAEDEEIASGLVS